MTCQAPPCHPLRSSLTDHTWDLTWSWGPVSVSQWIHKSCGPDECSGSTVSSRHRVNHLDFGNKRCWSAGTSQEEHLWRVEDDRGPAIHGRAGARTDTSAALQLSIPPLAHVKPLLCTVSDLRSLSPSYRDPDHGCARWVLLPFDSRTSPPPPSLPGFKLKKKKDSSYTLCVKVPEYVLSGKVFRITLG